MRTFRAKGGPFAEQPFFESAEIETICTDELHRVGLYPSSPGRVRIDRFIEKRFGILPTYADLPNGLLGFARFSKAGVEEIVVARSLDDAGGEVAERRLRTTLAHEAGHGLLHAHLFALEVQPGLLSEDGSMAEASKVLCREGAATGGETAAKHPYRWWEFQANQAMSALLLPKKLVQQALGSVLQAEGLLGSLVLRPADRDRATQLLAETFDVNPVVARIRLEGMYPRAAAGQLTL